MGTSSISEGCGTTCSASSPSSAGRSTPRLCWPMPLPGRPDELESAAPSDGRTDGDQRPIQGPRPTSSGGDAGDVGGRRREVARRRRLLRSTGVAESHRHDLLIARVRWRHIATETTLTLAGQIPFTGWRSSSSGWIEMTAVPRTRTRSSTPGTRKINAIGTGACPDLPIHVITELNQHAVGVLAGPRVLPRADHPLRDAAGHELPGMRLLAIVCGALANSFGIRPSLSLTS